MPNRPLRRTLIAVAIAQIFSITNVGAEEISSTSALETIVIEAQRSSNSVARLAQKEAPNLINLITAEEMRKLPDVNIAESVRRLPGISLETDTGEGRFINIRGLDADLNSTTFGGLRLPPSNNATPFSGGRAVALDAIPTGLVGAITVTKTNLPEQDAEALGGTIEITPKTAPRNGKAFFEGHIGSGREQLRGTGITDLSFSAGRRFGGGEVVPGAIEAMSDHPFSIVVTGAYYEDKRGVDDVEPSFIDDGVNSPLAYSGIEQRWYQYHRQRHGTGIDLGYQPNASSAYYFRAFDAGYTETVQRQRLVITPDGSPAATSTGFIDGLSQNGFDKTLRDEKETINNKVFVLGGKNTLGDKVLDYRMGLTRGSYNKEHDYNSDFNYTPASNTSPTISYNNSGPGNVPTFTVNGADYLNPANYSLAKFQNSTQSISDKEWSLAVNLMQPVNWGNFDQENVKVGASTRMRTRTVNGQPYSYTNLPALPMTSASSGSNLTFYDGLYQNGPQLRPGYLQNLFASNQTISANDSIKSALQFQSDKEDVSALYGQYQITLGKLGIIGGIRAEHTRATYAANSKSVDSSNNTYIVPSSQDKNYLNFFPSLQARYQMAPATLVRAAFSSTIARPGFNQVNASINISPSTNTVTQGNPDLKPITAHSFDLSIEHYLPNAGIVSAGIFDKEISNYIVNSVSDQTISNTGIYSGFVGVAHVYSFSNVGNARAAGIELNYEQRFKKLPGIWSGLGTGMNYTFVNSKVEIRPGEFSMLPSTSRNTANASLFYERKGMNLRLGAYFVSRNLWAIGGNGTPDTYSDARTSLDFGSSFTLDDNMSLYFNAKNLSNTPLKFSEGTSKRTTQREFYGATYQAGLNLSY